MEELAETPLRFRARRPSTAEMRGQPCAHEALAGGPTPVRATAFGAKSPVTVSCAYGRGGVAPEVSS